MICLAVTACSDGSSTGASPASGGVRASPTVYTTQGDVEEVLVDKAGRTRAVIRHGEIPKFRNREGRVVGMKPMAMRFLLPKDAPPLSKGDHVRFSFAVQWDSEDMLVVKRLTKADETDPR